MCVLKSGPQKTDPARLSVLRAFDLGCDTGGLSRWKVRATWLGRSLCLPTKVRAEPDVAITTALCSGLAGQLIRAWLV